MTTPKLDRSKDFGTIWPPFEGALVEQGGHYFGSDDVYRFSMNENGQRYDLGGKAPKAPAPPASRSPTANGQANKVDLAAWARGEAKYVFGKVKKAVTEAHPNIDVANARSIRQGLVAAGVVTAEEAGLAG